DEEWEIVGYRTGDGHELELRQPWQAFTPPAAAASPSSAGGNGTAALAMGLDIQTEAVRQVKQLFFAPTTVARARRPSGQSGGHRGSPGPVTEAAGGEVAASGLDLQTEAVRQAKQIFFAPETLAASARLAQPARSLTSAADNLATRMPGVFRA